MILLVVLSLSLRPIGGKRIGGNFVHLHSQSKTQPNFYFIHSYLLDFVWNAESRISYCKFSL